MYEELYLVQRKSNIILSTIVILITSTVIFGWIINSLTIVKLSPNFPPMQFNTAFCLLLLAIANIIPKKTKISFTRCFISIMVLVIASGTLLEYLFNLNLGLDNIFYKTCDSSLYPGRMSPNTAICFTLLALANTFTQFKFHITLFKALYSSAITTVVLITLIAFLGYLFNISYYFNWGYVTGMALHTTACMFLLAISRLSFRTIHNIWQKLAIIISSIIFVMFFILWLYSVHYDDQRIYKQIGEDLLYIKINLSNDLSLEYSAIDRLYKRLITNSYSSDKAIYSDFQAYADDYPSIYFIEYTKNNKLLFLSNYDLSKSNSPKILNQCNAVDKSENKLICIKKQEGNFNVVFKPNFSEQTIERYNSKNYNLEIYLNKSKVYSNLKNDKEYTKQIKKHFKGNENWTIIANLTTNDYENMQRIFPTIFFVLGVIISLMSEIFFYFLDINARKNKILRSRERKLKELSSTDTLTKSLNRHALMSRLNSMLSSNRKKDLKLSLLFIDLDNFKYINDNYGHNVGDKILTETSYRLKDTLRSDDLIARIGGDEFVVVLTDIDSREAITAIVSRMLKLFESSMYISNEISITQFISIGISTYESTSNEYMTADELIKQADKAMYIAKSKGKNNYYYYNP